MDEYTYSTHICLTQKEMEATSADTMAVVEGLGRNIQKHLGNIELGKSVRIFLRDSGDKIVGGIIGDIFSNWMYISLLWVEETVRNRGYGRELLNRLERVAIQLGCIYAHLDTYSFEARPFYEQVGYQVFAELKDYPAGYSKYFLKKALVMDGSTVKNR